MAAVPAEETEVTETMTTVETVGITEPVQAAVAGWEQVGITAPVTPIISPAADTQTNPGAENIQAGPETGDTARPGSRNAGTLGSKTEQDSKPQGGREPFVKGADIKIGWDVIRAEEEMEEDGDTIHIDMNCSVVVPGDIFDSIKGKDITWGDCSETKFSKMKVGDRNDILEKYGIESQNRADLDRRNVERAENDGRSEIVFGQSEGELTVTENVVDTGDDTHRIAFIKEATKGVADCVADGLPVNGYLYWYLLDNFE